MLVSVVMAVYNAAPFLNEAIQSLIDQTYTNWELIAVDDGSTDNSLEILESYSDSRIKVIKRQNGGQCAATNTGLYYIMGECVLFFDADDLMDVQKIEMQVESLKEAPESVSVGKWAFFQKSIDEAVFKDEPIYCSGTPAQWLSRLWSNDTMMPNHGYLIPRTVLEKAGSYYDENILLNVDFEYFTRIILAANSVIYCPNSICYYRKGIQTSKTYSASLKKKLSALQAREKAIKNFLLHYNDEHAKHAARMALTILTFSYPSIRKYAKRSLLKLGLENFAHFGGDRFKRFSRIIGFEKAICLKAFYERFR